MAERKLIDADGHIREIESDVFEYLPEHYKTRRDAVLYFPLLPHHGWHRQAGSGGMGASFLVPTLEDWQKALDQGNIEAAVVYPTRFMHIGQVGMVDFAVDLSRAYNDYLYDRFLMPGIATQGNRCAAVARCRRSRCRAAPRSEGLRHGGRSFAGRRIASTLGSSGFLSSLRGG